MPRTTKKVSPSVGDPAPVQENTKVRKGKRPAEDVPEEHAVPSKAPKTAALAKSKQPTVNGETAPKKPSTASKPAKSKKAVVSSNLEEANSATLYCFGNNDGGQLGFECEKRKFPALVPSLEKQKFVTVVCGGMHTLALEANGHVWSFGINDDKALGRHTEEEEDGFEPGRVEIPGNSKVVQISAGDSHSAALTEDGVVYAWGCFKDDNGNFGLIADGGEICREKPEKITSNLGVKIKKISSGCHHITMLGEDGFVYTCGAGSQGQLGRLYEGPKRVTRSGAPDSPGTAKEIEKKYLLTPSVVKFGRNPKISDIWTGEYSTYCMSEKGGDIYVCGLNNYSQLGIKKTKNGQKDLIFKPTKNTTFRGTIWKQIAAGMHHAIALDEQGKVYTIGRNTDGRLGLGPEDPAIDLFGEPKLVPGLADKSCIHVAAGGSTSYAITSEGHLYAWGFGENYQLATGDDEDRNVPVRCLGKRGKDTSGQMVSTDINGKVVCVQAGGQHVALTISLPTDINGNS